MDMGTFRLSSNPAAHCFLHLAIWSALGSLYAVALISHQRNFVWYAESRSSALVPTKPAVLLPVPRCSTRGYKGCCQCCSGAQCSSAAPGDTKAVASAAAVQCSSAAPGDTKAVASAAAVQCSSAAPGGTKAVASAVRSAAVQHQGGRWVRASSSGRIPQFQPGHLLRQAGVCAWWKPVPRPHLPRASNASNGQSRLVGQSAAVLQGGV